MRSFGRESDPHLSFLCSHQETPLTPRRIPVPRRTPAVPRLQPDLGTSDKASSPVPSLSETEEPGDLILPPSVSGLAPIILTARLKPPQTPPPSKFQQLKQTVAQRLGSLDPAWLQRCQGTLGDKEMMLGDMLEQGETKQPPSKQDEGVTEVLVGDSMRKRPRGDGDDGDNMVAPAKLQRCCQSSSKEAFGAAKELKQNKEEKEEEDECVASQMESRKVPHPSENILGELEEEEEKKKPRATRGASAPRWVLRNQLLFP